ncbi:hypothetical protein BDL97_11G098100 [Sphagnum fallax]|nr:hypothetical protein BDL97_11G098100 [Sphagnum fallax]KAH8948516.1 hypothetical protein BDL97_11G098100 [Sphagnum fallax]
MVKSALRIAHGGCSKVLFWYENSTFFHNSQGHNNIWKNVRLLTTKQFVPPRNPFGIAFDIDGVLLRGREPIGRAPESLARLYKDVKNGGGMTESARAAELTRLLGVPIAAQQVLLGHSPFMSLSHRFKSKRVLSVGKGAVDEVLASYGFRKVVKIDEYVEEFDSIDPLESYKPWVKQSKSSRDILMPSSDQKISAVFVCSDPVDWGRDLQVLCDVLRSGGLPGKAESESPQPPLFFAADDLEYQAKFPVTRFGMGAFRLALETLYKEVVGHPLAYHSYGKPKAVVYKLAENSLQHVAKLLNMKHGKPLTSSEKVVSSHLESATVGEVNEEHCALKTIYMIGDNPETDIAGAIGVGRPWFSILVKTGCFREPENHPLYPADKVVEDVYEAIDFIAQNEGIKLS